MPKGDNITEWNEEYQTFTFNSKYNFKKFAPVIKQHFNEGGLNSSYVLAGLCEVSHQTILDWLNSSHSNFKKDFKILVDTHSHMAAVITDKWHRESASGARKDANARTLNRRAERILGLTENKKQEITHTVKKKTLDELDAGIAEIDGFIENEQ